jgi:hypothetical protein
LTEPRLLRARRSASMAMSLGGAAVLVVLLALYAERTIIAGEVLTRWLRSHGVASDIDVQTFGIGGATARVRAGDPEAPDFSAGEVNMTWGFRGFKFGVRSVTLRRVVVRARLHDGHLSMGSLDPLIAELIKRPPQPEAPKPRIEIKDGVLLLSTAYGPVRLTANAVVQMNRLVFLSAQSSPTRLHSALVDLTLGAGTAGLRTVGDRIAVTLDLPVPSLVTGKLTATGTHLRLSSELPYPDLQSDHIHGDVALRVNLTSDSSAFRGDNLRGVELATGFHGLLNAGLSDLVLTGPVNLVLNAKGGTVGTTRLGAMEVTAAAPNLRWARNGSEAISATPSATMTLEDVASGELRLSRLLAKTRGSFSYASHKLNAAVTGSLLGRGDWNGLGLATATDSAILVALKRAAHDFQIGAPAVAVRLNGGEVQVALPQPVSLRSYGGSVVTLSSLAGAPIFGPIGGAFKFAVKGGDLPAIYADIRDVKVGQGATTAQGAAKAAFSLGPVQDATFDASGLLRMEHGELRFTADRCLPITAVRVAFGANELERISALLCPWREPLFTMAKGGWHFAAKVTDVTGQAPFLQAELKGGAGSVIADQKAGLLSVDTEITGADLMDDATARRFNPLQVSGAATLADGRWDAAFDVRESSGIPVARVALRHNTGDGRGGAVIDTGLLTFAEGGLQPVQLSPFAAALGSAVRGQVQFTGRLDWSAAGATSEGTLTVPGLDIESPVGRVNGLKGAVEFTSLAPLVAPPEQTLSAKAITAVVPIADVTARFGLDASDLTVTNGEATMGGGQIRIERLNIPLASDVGATGVLALDGVQLHDIVAASPFGDRVDLNARVSGRVPFESMAGKVQIASAELHAVEPGRLSIKRQALTGVAAASSVSAQSGPPAPVAANDTFTDFAYQALENLAFDKLNATIATRTDGRLGILAHITGRHDPPQHQEIRISLLDLIRRKFLSRPLPLPSDTQVDLTLDTTLNLDDILADYGDYRRLRNSPAIQPASPTTPAKPLETSR